MSVASRSRLSPLAQSGKDGRRLQQSDPSTQHRRVKDVARRELSGSPPAARAGQCRVVFETGGNPGGGWCGREDRLQELIVRKCLCTEIGWGWSWMKASSHQSMPQSESGAVGARKWRMTERGSTRCETG